MVYQSQLLAPDMEIQWTANYGLNWTANSPNPGATVNYAGNWQPCAAGESYDLNNVGAWVPNQSNPNAKPNCLNVGNNDYGESVYISVRVQDASGNWSPIWVSPDKLVQQSGGEYEPLEAITLWYQEGSQTSTMVSTQQTKLQQYTMAPNEGPVYFSYGTAEKKWLEPQITPFTLPS